MDVVRERIGCRFVFAYEYMHTFTQKLSMVGLRVKTNLRVEMCGIQDKVKAICIKFLQGTECLSLLSLGYWVN